jgi:hypothetical protein
VPLGDLLNSATNSGLERGISRGCVGVEGITDGFSNVPEGGGRRHAFAETAKLSEEKAAIASDCCDCMSILRSSGPAVRVLEADLSGGGDNASGIGEGGANQRPRAAALSSKLNVRE